jgi:hypothetical protein
MSKIAICNIALAALGEDSIRSFDEQNKRARMAEVFFTPVQKYLLSQYDWSFARKFVSLQKLSGVEVPDGYYLYQLPSDCERVRDLWPKGSKQWWDVHGDTLMCKQSDGAYIYYTSTNIDPTKFPAPFAMLTATLLAVKMSPAITQDYKVTNSLFSQYKNEVKECWAGDANTSNDHISADNSPQGDSFVNPEGSFLPVDEYNGRL